MVVFCFSPPRCVPTCVVFLNFPHNASHLPTSFLYEDTPISIGVCFFALKPTTISTLPEDPGPRSTKQLHPYVSAYINANVLNPCPTPPSPHPATSNPKNL